MQTAHKLFLQTQSCKIRQNKCVSFSLVSAYMSSTFEGFANDKKGFVSNLVIRPAAFVCRISEQETTFKKSKLINLMKKTAPKAPLN